MVFNKIRNLDEKNNKQISFAKSRGGTDMTKLFYKLENEHYGSCLWSPVGHFTFNVLNFCYGLALCSSWFNIDLLIIL